MRKLPRRRPSKYRPRSTGLTEGIFKFGWKGKTIAETFEQIRSTMPLRNARSLDDQTYLDILAYILQFNGAPGKSEAGA